MKLSHVFALAMASAAVATTVDASERKIKCTVGKDGTGGGSKVDCGEWHCFDNNDGSWNCYSKDWDFEWNTDCPTCEGGKPTPGAPKPVIAKDGQAVELCEDGTCFTCSIADGCKLTDPSGRSLQLVAPDDGDPTAGTVAGCIGEGTKLEVCGVCIYEPSGALGKQFVCSVSTKIGWCSVGCAEKGSCTGSCG